MELNRFKPYGFTNLYDVMDYHIHQVHRLLVRHMFTERQFLTGTIPHNIRDLKFVLERAVFDLFVVITLIFANTEIFPIFVTYNQIVGKSFGVKEPRKISFSYLMMILCLLDCIYMSFVWLMQGRMYLIRVLYEWRRTLDITVKGHPQVYNNMLNYFNYASYATGLNIKAMAIIISFLVYQVCLTSVDQLWTGSISTFDATSCIVIFSCAQLQFAMLQYVCYTLLCGFFLCLKILKHETRLCLALCSRINRQSHVTGHSIKRLRWNLMMTNRRISWYNMQAKEYNFSMDTLSMLSTTWALANVLKTPDLIGFIFLALFFPMFLHSYFMGERTSFFKDSTVVMSQRLHTFSAVYSNSKLKPKENEKKLFRLIKVEDTISFLSKCKFGFTCGSQYIYTTLRVVENMLFYICILMLLFKTSKKNYFNM